MSYCLETFPEDNSLAAEFVQTDADENSLNLFCCQGSCAPFYFHTNKHSN